MAGSPTRKSLEETWRYLEREGESVPRDATGRPFVPVRMPSHDDDEPLGFSYFRYRLEDANNSNLTLPRTLFGRSLFCRVNFAATDLSESRMCWNDFVECDFSGSDLSRCDLRASNFKGCKFVGAVLRDADLRRSSYEDCDFAGAELDGAVGVNENAIGWIRDYLTNDQQAVMVWAEDSGAEPPGG
ncbi:pentapeptide repeat-containing protein [Singulisphaera rosea]